MSKKYPKEMRNCKVILSTEELATRAQTLAITLRDYDVMEEEMKAKAAQSKEALKGLRVTSAILATAVRDKAEYRSVPCEWIPNFTDKLMELCRLDTGEIVDSRAMTGEELQGDLSLMETPSKRSDN